MAAELINRRSVFLAGGALAAASQAEALGWLSRKGGSTANGVSYATLLGPKFFALGTWVPRSTEIAALKARGINVALNLQDDFSMGAGTGPAWRAACEANGMYMIVRRDHLGSGSDMAAADAGNPWVLAHMLWDEPDGGARKTPAELADEVTSLRAAGSTKPIFVNYLGNSMAFQFENAPYTDEFGMTPYENADYLNVPGIDWFSSDIYPPMFGAEYVYGWATALDKRDSFTTTPGAATRNVRFGPFNYATPGSAGKAVFGYVATGRISGPTGRYLTEAEFRCYCWSMIINGVSGVLLFPQYFPEGGGQINDDTNATMLAALADLKTKVAVLENQGGVNVLMDTVNGGRRTFTPRRCADTFNGDPAMPPNFKTPVGNQLQAPFEGCEWAGSNGETYRLVLNLFDSAQTLTDAPWGLTSNAFAARQVKCFKASAPTVDIFAA